MEQVMELAQSLGKAIAASSQAQKLVDARKQLSAQPQVEQLLKDFQQQSEKIARLEKEQKPIEVEDKHKLEELSSKLVSNDLFKKFTAAQVDYVDLMRKVNDALRKELAPIES